LVHSGELGSIDKGDGDMSKIYARIPGLDRPGKRIEFKVEESKPEIGDYYGRTEVVSVEEFRPDVEDHEASEYNLYKVTTFDQREFDEQESLTEEDELDDLKKLCTEIHYIAVEAQRTGTQEQDKRLLFFIAKMVQMNL
jgi:hypothetical protein